MRAPSGEQVVEANRRFYDTVADVYETVDRRRSSARADWLEAVFDDIERRLPPRGKDTRRHFVDAGAGTGFLAQAVAQRFDTVTLIDVSQRMLDRVDLPCAEKVCADVCQTPLESASVDVVGAFATLHHLHSPRDFFREAFRVLRPGGVLYTDHDIERTFVRAFRLPLTAYRAIFDHEHGYRHACPSLTREDYALTEFHGDRGLDGSALLADLKALGFESVRAQYHWEGMGPVSDVLNRLRVRRALSIRGLAPVVRVVAVKPC